MPDSSQSSSTTSLTLNVTETGGLRKLKRVHKGSRLHIPQSCPRLALLALRLKSRHRLAQRPILPGEFHHAHGGHGYRRIVGGDSISPWSGPLGSGARTGGNHNPRSRARVNAKMKVSSSADLKNPSSSCLYFVLTGMPQQALGGKRPFQNGRTGSFSRRRPHARNRSPILAGLQPAGRRVMRLPSQGVALGWVLRPRWGRCNALFKRKACPLGSLGPRLPFHHPDPNVLCRAKHPAFRPPFRPIS